jgi:Fatty acid desaturase
VIAVTTADSAGAGDEVSVRPGGSDYARLSRAVRQAGLMDRRTGNYAWRIAITVFLLAAGWVAVVLAGNSWWQLALAVFLAVMFTQVGFLGHDAGHRQICASRRLSYILGIVMGNLGIGLSFGWWVAKHNQHHAHPNTEGADPDIMMRALAMTTGQAGSSHGVSRMVFRRQAFLFFPMLPGEAFSVHVASIRALASRNKHHRLAEAALLARLLRNQRGDPLGRYLMSRGQAGRREAVHRSILTGPPPPVPGIARPTACRISNAIGVHQIYVSDIADRCVDVVNSSLEVPGCRVIVHQPFRRLKLESREQQSPYDDVAHVVGNPGAITR